MESAFNRLPADGSYGWEERCVRTVVGIAVAGSIGALARYGLEGLISRRTVGAFPWGTFVVNISGSFLLGLLFTVLTDQISAPSWLRSTLTIGLLGAYTTFSTLSFASYRLVEDGAYGIAAANMVGSLAVGLLAVYLGVVTGRAI
jgi:fluoride exporter